MKPKLFYTPGACSIAPHAALCEAGADFDLERVKFAENQQRSPEYLALNPLGRVPALQTERGVISEVTAILTYVARTWPKAKLLPLDDPWATAEVESFNAFLSSSVHVAFAHRSRPYRWADDEATKAAMAAKAPEVIRGLMDIVEARLEANAAAGPWVHGAGYTTSDPYLCFISRMGVSAGVIGPKRYPRVLAHLAEVQARPSVAAALAAEGLTPI